ncbi:DUF1273 domain-containing protein [Bacillus sp. PS06]|uniref:DUF1273 domain-containing protein n=1 Tax=Bacillus sp. PS06 TaxID=2764176 RepID=UPI001783CB71|nr:DUF1273 domain-containing protein [Bacillus sp. PS06]MBD8070183.1 DUF1273 domain-containing protein [Bacillus sp. PS06]
MKVVAITGYKPFELGLFDIKHPGITYIKKAIKNQLISMLDEGLEWVIISGQLGVELWAAEVVFDLQLEYPHLQLAVITPFLEQEENWNETNKELYEFIVSQADYTNSITNKKYENPMQFRLKNRFFIDKSDALLIVYDEENEGSPKYIYQLAKQELEQSDYQLFVINGYDLQVIAEEEQFREHDF